MLVRTILLSSLLLSTSGSAQEAEEACSENCTKEIQGFFEVEGCDSARVEYHLMVDENGNGTFDIRLICNGVIIPLPEIPPELPGILG